MKEIKIGTRGSALALAQSNEVMRQLQRRHPAVRFRLVKIRTEGDEFKSVHLFKKNGVGVFTKEIEKYLLSGQVDLAVHSMKDLPTKIAAGLRLAAVPKRARVSDALISGRRFSLKNLPKGSSVGTGSPRRKSQLGRLRPDLKLVDLRGNLDTRVNKVLRDKTLDAIVVARAGLERLGRFARHWTAIDPALLLPAVGQGALALQARGSDRFSLKIAGALNHAETERLVAAERAFLARLGGGCRVPVGMLSVKKGSKIRLRAAVYSTRSGDFLEETVEGPWKDALKAARRLAERLLRRGAGRFLSEARAQ